MQFLGKSDVVLLNGGYLSDVTTGKPVYHDGFVFLQNRAKFLDVLSKKVEKATFEVKSPDNFLSIFKETEEEIGKAKEVVYVEAPKEPAQKISNSLKDEALSWLKFQGEKESSDSVNEFMQDFNVLVDFENYGLFFQEGIVKLDKIYTIKEIQEFAKILEPHYHSL